MQRPLATGSIGNPLATSGAPAKSMPLTDATPPDRFFVPVVIPPDPAAVADLRRVSGVHLGNYIPVYTAAGFGLIPMDVQRLRQSGNGRGQMF